MDRFVLGIGIRAITDELNIGDIVCHSNLDHNLSSPADNGSYQDKCGTLNNYTVWVKLYLLNMLIYSRFTGNMRIIGTWLED